MKKYLCLYDYGTGGVWIYILAGDKHHIKERFPGFTDIFSPGEEPEFAKTDEFQRNLETIELTEKRIKETRMYEFLKNMESTND